MSTCSNNGANVLETTILRRGADADRGESERWDKNIEREHEGDTCEAHYEGYENDGYTNES